MRFSPLPAVSITGLLPLVARDMLGGGASTYGLLLGAFGAGAVVGAFAVPAMQRKFKSEDAIRVCTLLIGVAHVTLAFSRSLSLSVIALLVAGGGWTTSSGLFNIGVQFSAPRWVAGRALAFFQTAIAGGAAIGAWAWGHRRRCHQPRNALLISGGMMLASILLGSGCGMPDVSRVGFDAAEALADPEVRLPLTARQRADRDRNRIPRRAGARARILRADAEGAALSPAQRRLWLVDRPRHRR